MSISSNKILPVAEALGTTSCIRLRQRMKVDLPQPEGPMMAVTCLAMIGTVIPLRISALPKPARRFETCILGRAAPVLVDVVEAEEGPAMGSSTSGLEGETFFGRLCSP